MIQVTKTFLPPINEYENLLSRAWNNGWITNRGELVKELENKLELFLESSPLIAMTNGTLPLQIAIKALGLKGEIITTPFSYVATTSSIVWEGCIPRFVDIDLDHLTIDETKIEAAININTSAILATHIFGNPCSIEIIERLAQRYNLRVIYDAAHCFGVEYNGKSIFNYGDVSTCSFHATKLFQTGEGGAIFCDNPELYDKLFYHHNFGHKGKEDFQGLGINAKMSELQAAMGLAILPYIKRNIKKRKKKIALYTSFLQDSVTFLKIRKGTDWNSSYFPIILASEQQLLQVMKKLNEHSIFPRRYFYPSLDTLSFIDKVHCKNSRSISSRILCLPLYESLEDKSIKKISNLILDSL